MRKVTRPATVRVQLPLALTGTSEPEPDVAVAPQRSHHGHPRSAILIIEVAGSTLRKDRTIKAQLYAAAGIPEYWIVNLIDRVVEVHRRPTRDGYLLLSKHGPSASLAPQALPSVRLRVRDILPTR